MLALLIFTICMTRDVKTAKFVPVRHKIWADNGSPINPIIEQAARSI